MRRLIADRNFRLLLFGQTLTMFGDVALFLVLAIWVKDLTGSSGAAGAVFLAIVVPALLAPLGGVLVDRFPRRRVMIVNDLATGLVILALLFVRDAGDIWIIYTVAALYGASQQVFFAARSGLLVSMVPGELLGEANGLLESLRQGLRVAGPLAGAALYGAFGGGATAALDSATFLASALFLSLLRVDERPARTRAQGAFLRELTEGARHVLRTPELRRVVGVFVLALCVVGFLEAALFALVDEGLGRTPAFVGVVGMIQGAGSAVGGVMAGRALRRFSEIPVIGAGSVLTGLGLAPLILATLPAVIVGTAVLGFGLAALMVGYMTLLQRRTPHELQGRVFAAAEAALTGPYAASIGAGALLISVVDFRLLYAANAIALAIAGIVLLAVPIRPGPRTEPEAPAAGEEPLLPLPEGVVPPG